MSLECPYCGAEQDAYYDDGDGTEEDVRYEHECVKCSKYFVFDTYIHFTHRTFKAPCLNGAHHNLKSTHTHPVQFTRMKCADCHYERTPTGGEMIKILRDREK